MATRHVVQEGLFDPTEFITTRGQQHLAELLASLVRAAKSYDPSCPNHGRNGIYMALLGVIKYVEAVIPQRPDLVLPLRDLLYGLRSLDDGTTVPLLQAAELGHRPPNAISVGVFRADAAALMDLKVAEMKVQKKKRFRDEAARAVAQELNRLGFRDDGNRILGKQVADWRERVMKAAQKPNYEATHYLTALRMLKAKFPDDPRAAFSFWLGCMTEMYPVTIPKKGRS